MSLCPHQPDIGIRSFSKPDFEILYRSALMGTSDSDEALDVIVTGFVYGSHHSSTANQLGLHRVDISDRFSKSSVENEKGRSYAQI